MAKRGSGAMHVAKVVRPYKDRVYTYFFLRQSYREGGKVKHRTLANLSHLPPDELELVTRSLKGERFVPAGAALRTVRTLPPGHAGRGGGAAPRRRWSGPGFARPPPSSRPPPGSTTRPSRGASASRAP